MRRSDSRHQLIPGVVGVSLRQGICPRRCVLGYVKFHDLVEVDALPVGLELKDCVRFVEPTVTQCIAVPQIEPSKFIE